MGMSRPPPPASAEGSVPWALCKHRMKATALTELEMPPVGPALRVGASFTFFPRDELARGFLVFSDFLSAGFSPVLLESLPHSKGSSGPLSLGPENLDLQRRVR